MIARLRQLARLELREGLRNRRQLVLRGCTPLVLILIVAGLAVLSGGAERRAGDEYRIGVEGDLEGARETLARVQDFDDGRLVLVPVERAAVALLDGEDAVIVLPADLDASIRAEQAPTVVIVTDPTSKPSRAAGSLVRAALVLGDQITTMPEVRDIEAAASGAGSGSRSLDALGSVLAALVLVSAGTILGVAAARVMGRRMTGTLVPQLLLPTSRTTLAGARTLTEVLLSVIAAVPLVGLLTLLSVAVAVSEDEARSALALAVVLPVAMVAIATPLAAAGITLGLRAQSSQQVSVIAGLTFVLTTLGARVVAVPPSDQTPIVSGLPIVGPADAIARTMQGTLDPAAFAISLIGTAAVAWLLIHEAARALDRDAIALRPS